jgi:hypothetical protein
VFTVTGEPQIAFVDAFKTRLAIDSELLAGGTSWRSITGVFGHLSEAARTAYPYVVLGRRSRQNNSGAMQIAGGKVTLQLDVWSDAKGPFEVSRLLSRIFALFERQPLRVSGYELVRGSVTCEFTEIFDEPDEDKPGAKLYHGVQRWTAEIHEAA